MPGQRTLSLVISHFITERSEDHKMFMTVLSVYNVLKILGGWYLQDVKCSLPSDIY